MTKSIAIFGGSFNPIHNGHLNSIKAVLESAEIEKLLLIPTSHNPLKVQVDSASPSQRLEMLKLAVDEIKDRRAKDRIVIEEHELKNQDASYTVDTLQQYLEKSADANYSIVLGADAFAEFDKWKEFDVILEKANLIVTSRPGSSLPQSKAELPPGVVPLVQRFTKTKVSLKSGKKIEFLELKDRDTSATEIRKKIRTSSSQEMDLPLPVFEYIQKNNLYKGLSSKINDFEDFAKFCADFLFESKAINVKCYDLRSIETAATDFSIIGSGTSTKHASSMGENLAIAIKKKFGVHPLSTEGVQEGRWILLDYGALIVHVFYDFVRQEYRIEELWRRARDMNLVDRGTTEKTIEPVK
jgi:nicotinate-nucleotide adenylyltransferase